MNANALSLLKYKITNIFLDRIVFRNTIRMIYQLKLSDSICYILNFNNLLHFNGSFSS